MKSVFILVEKYTENVSREENVFDKWILSVHSSLDGAISAMQKEHDELIEAIIDGDENELSRISADETYKDHEGNISQMCIVSDSCQEWELTIYEKKLED